METLPAEKILEICEHMDDASLSQFIRTSQRNYDICSEELQKRIDIVDKDIEDLHKNSFISYTRPYPEGQIFLSSNVDISYIRAGLIAGNYYYDIKQLEQVNLEIPQAEWVIGNDIPVFERYLDFGIGTIGPHDEMPEIYQTVVSNAIRDVNTVRRAIGRIRHLGYIRLR